MNWTAKDAQMARPVTTKLLEMVEEGAFDKDLLIRDLLGWMSEADVKEFAERNDLLPAVEPEPEDDGALPPSDVDELHHWWNEGCPG
jgi:hypothetical protein